MTDDEFNEMADRRHFVLNPEAFDAWEAMLDAPPKDCPKLRELMQSESLFDHNPDLYRPPSEMDDSPINLGKQLSPEVQEVVKRLASTAKRIPGDPSRAVPPTIIVHELASDEWIEAHHIYTRGGRIVVEIRP